MLLPGIRPRSGITPLFTVYARYIANRTRRDGSALMHRMEGTKAVTKPAEEAAAVLPKYSR
jgi:hypothetical protein